MGPAVFILAIMGCGEGSALCDQVAVAPTPYVSFEACTAGSGEAMSRYLDANYPVLVAQCRPATAAEVAQLKESDVKLPDRKANGAPNRGPWALTRARG